MIGIHRVPRPAGTPWGVRTALRRLAVAAVALLLLLVGSLVAAAPAYAGLTHRTCASRTVGNFRLDFCIRGWVDSTNDHTRAVVEMHSYRYVGGGVPGGWVDSISKSLTVNSAEMSNGANISYIWGNNGAQKCRVNGPGGSVACSVPNTSGWRSTAPTRRRPVPPGTPGSTRCPSGTRPESRTTSTADNLEMIYDSWVA